MERVNWRHLFVWLWMLAILSLVVLLVLNNR
jgi:hypothetical protein